MVTTAIVKKQPIPETSRFNWKDGFYSPEKIEIYKAMNEKAAAERVAGFGKSKVPYRKSLKNGNRNGGKPRRR